MIQRLFLLVSLLWDVDRYRLLYLSIFRWLIYFCVGWLGLTDWLTSLTIHYHTRLNLLVFGWLRYYAVINIDVQSLSFFHGEPSSLLLLLLLLTAKVLILVECCQTSELTAHTCATVSLCQSSSPSHRDINKQANYSIHGIWQFAQKGSCRSVYIFTENLLLYL